MATTRKIEYTSFATGEWGLKGGDNANDGAFHGLNIMVYSNGFVGPRPGLKNFTPASMPVGKLRALVETPTPDREGMFIIGNTAYYSSFRDFTIAPVALTGDVLSAGSSPLHPHIDTTTFLVADPDSPGGVWRLDQVAGTMAQLSGAPAGTDLAIYDSQLIIVGSSDRPRLFGSAPTEDGVTYDFSDGMFQDVGDNWGIGAILVQNNYLAIIKRNSIHVMSGVFGTDSMVIRTVNSAVATKWAWNVTRDNDERIWFLPLFRENPASFTGATVAQLGQYTHLEPREEDDNTLPMKRGITAFQGQLNNSSMLAVEGGDVQNAILNHNGVMTYHHFDVPVTGMIASLNNHVVLTDGGTDSTAASLYACNFEWDRPAFTTDDNASPGDGTDTPFDCELEIPHYFAPVGRYGQGGSHLVRVRSVVVEVLKYDTGVATNSLNMTVTTINRTNGAGEVVNPTRSWTDAHTNATTEGVHDRITFPVMCAWGQGWKINLTSIVGIAIKSVTIEYEPSDNLPRTDNDG